MSESRDRSLVPQPPRQLAVPLAARSRIVSEMVECSLALAKHAALADVDLDALVRRGKRIQRRQGVTPEDVQAFTLFDQAARAGHVEAQYHLSSCYALGNGVRKDNHSASRWLHKSAEQGYPRAQYYLGLCYEAGLLNIAPDERKSDKWYREAAERGNVDAQLKIGELYRDGLGVDRDYKQAATWYQRAAKQGHADAQYELGLFFRGCGGRANHSFRFDGEKELLNDFFHEQVAMKLANLFLGEKFHFDVLNVYTGEIIIPAHQKLTDTLLRKLAGDFNPDEIYPPKLSQKIQEIIDNLEQTAAAWFRRAAEQGHADAQINLATCYQFGVGVAINLLLAYAWLLLAADQKAELAKSMRVSFGFALTADKEAANAQESATALAAEMSPSEMEIAQRLYTEFKERYSARQ